MPQIELGAGLTLSYPAGADVTTYAQRPAAPMAPGGARRGRRATPAASTGSIADFPMLLTELRNRGFVVAGQFTVSPKPQRRNTAANRRALPGLGDQTSTVSVDLAANEDAIVLTVGDDDEIDWVFADGTTVSGNPVAAGARKGNRSRKPSADRRSSRAASGAAATESRQATFTIGGAGASRRRTSTRASTRRSLLGGILRGVAGWVLKFVRRKITGALIRHLEKSVTRGLVRITTNVPTEWSILGESGSIPGPQRADGTPSRVLLLVHGTFSSTVGSFGGLAFSLPGTAFLDSVRAQYDHIIGWDHYTLSATPDENAVELKALLERTWPVGTTPPIIDAIAFSRGGLVLRTLLEQQLAGTRWSEQFKRVVFVASTLSGTKLAQRKHWKAFITIISNIAVGACRAVATLVPPAAVATVWVETVARGVAVLVRFIATAALDAEAVPGLAAMDPDQKVIKDINRTPPPPLLLDRYHAITNDFEPGGRNAADASDAMPSALMLRLWDLVIDAEMREANDLVVHERSMHSLGADVIPEARILQLPQNGHTMHTTSFRDVDVIAQLRLWLIDGAQPAAAREGANERLRARNGRRALRRKLTA